MRRLTAAHAAALSILAAALALPGCRTKEKQAQSKQSSPVAAVADAPLASVVDTGDPHYEKQLLGGFYGIENQSWRWSAKNFSVKLRPIKGADHSGAKLDLKFVIPEVMFRRVGAMTLDAKANGLDLGPQTFSKMGDAEYIRDVSPVVLAGDSTTFEFSVDKGLPPSAKDPRELAVIVTSVGLVPK